MQVWMTLAGRGAAAAAPALRPTRSPKPAASTTSGQYDNAARLARDAIKVPTIAEGRRGWCSAASISSGIAGRPTPTIWCRRAKRCAPSTPRGSTAGRRAELTIGLGEALFLDDRFGPAAELFERALDSSSALGARRRTTGCSTGGRPAVDRLALTGPRDAREPSTPAIVTRMEKELAADPASAPGGLLAGGGGPRRRQSRARLERRDGGLGDAPRLARTTAPRSAPTSIG